MIIDAVREYMMLCPQLSGKKININCLGTKVQSFSIDNVSKEPVIKKYCDGEELKQAVFNLSVRDRYDENLGGNLQVTQLLEEVENWIWKQNSMKKLPELGSENMIARSIEVTQSGHLYHTSMSSGCWQMEFRILYRQKLAQ